MNSDLGLRIALGFISDACRPTDPGPRLKCEHGRAMPRWPGAGVGNWGEWRCACRNSRAYCQDCGAPVSELSGECMAYEESKGGNE